MNTDDLRILILRIARVNGTAGTTAACIRAQIRTEDKHVSEKRIAESIAYLVDRGLLIERKSKVSATMRLRVGADGIDFLDEEGF